MLSELFFPMCISVSVWLPLIFWVICLMGSVSFLAGVVFGLLKCNESVLFSNVFLQ